MGESELHQKTKLSNEPSLREICDSLSISDLEN